MTRRICIGVAAIAALALPGCPSEEDPVSDIIIYGLTAAPPASTGRIVNDDLDGYRVTLTRGVAIGARCWDSCDGTCKAPAFTVDDPTLLGVRPLWRPGAGDAEVVLVGNRAGTTRLVVHNSCYAREYVVEILDPVIDRG